MIKTVIKSPPTQQEQEKEGNALWVKCQKMLKQDVRGMCYLYRRKLFSPIQITMRRNHNKKRRNRNGIERKYSSTQIYEKVLHISHD